LDSFIANIGIQTFRAGGGDVDDVYIASQKAIDYSRSMSRPALLLIKDLPRRFGHAATDRQLAYMSADQILAEADRNPLAAACTAAIERNLFSQDELMDKFQRIQSAVEDAFQVAVNEPKITDVEALVASNSQPLTYSVSSWINKNESSGLKHSSVAPSSVPGNSSKPATVPDAMRKHMNRVYDEILKNQPDTIYIGEDVTHGGYYLVTEGLAAKHPNRVLDFPPDETTLVGAAMGMSQAGFVPIVEIPYAKYLDCGGDMFSELCILNWLNNANANKQPHTETGVFVRLQGFDRGVFGGNYHTHNMLNVLYPGLDVVCYSNGYDYVRGIRYAMKQVRAGRVVMSVDSTDLLNKRHLRESDGDAHYLSIYPESAEEELSFDTVMVYEHDGAPASAKHVLLVSYGNGVGAAKLARAALTDASGQDQVKVTIIDCPYLSAPPGGLVKYLEETKGVDAVVFADVCKEASSMPLLGIANDLNNRGLFTCPYTVIGKCTLD
jgi:2-oxoisovalerate dehydrogenase E1 component